MSAVRIEPAHPSDDATLLALAKEAGLQLSPADERLRPQARLLVARGESEVALGFILGWLVADELEIIDVCVDKASRRGGLGTLLLRHLLDEALEGGAQNAFLEVRRSNRAAHKLYENHGFSETGIRERYYRDGEDALLFRCCLGAGT